mgnify:CR=1 FL=1|jgi:hypothetical protein
MGFFILTFTGVITAHADELFIPPNMLISGDYQGVFIRDDSKMYEIISLASNSDIIGIPDSLFFTPDQNHATFDITLHGLGDGVIIARTGETFYNVTTSIHSDQRKDYNIFLLLPEKTSTAKITGMVFLVDDFFNPVYADGDVFVSFATKNIDVPKQLKIASGDSFASFSANIRGDSWITAYTDKSTSGTINIDFNTAKKEVHIGIAPESVIAPYSFAHLFVWLSENNTPLEPTLPIKSTLHVSDADILGIDGLDNSDTIYLREGFAMKKLTTNHPGESSITINVPGYGTASADVTVGSLFNSSTTELLSDVAVANIFPPITSKDAHLVWSMYEMDSDSKLYPTYGDMGVDFFITSQNLIHEGVVSFENDQRRTQSNVIPISGSIIGNHSISISSTVTLGVITSDLEIASPVKYSLSVVSLPPLNLQDKRPLFAVSVLDSDGHVVNPHVIFGDLSVTLLSDDVAFTKNTIFLDEAVNIIWGTSNVLYPSVTILANDHDIVTSQSYKPTSNLLVDIQMPKNVHSGEKFPAYVFLTDTDGKPLSDISKYIQSKCDEHGKLFSCVVDSEFVLFENAIGFATKTLSVFENQFEPDDVSFDLGDGDFIGVGSNFVIPYEIPSDAIIDVITSIPYDLDNDAVTLKPNFIGEYDVYFTVSKPGFEKYETHASYFVNDSIRLTISTVNENDVSIPSSVSISRTGETLNVSTPESIDIPRGDMHFEFRPSITIDSTGYSFDYATISGIIYDSPIIDILLVIPTDITATYGRVVNIITSNANGGGLYDYGESVTLYAPPHDVVGFLIRDVFDYWEYLPAGNDVYSQTVTLTATESFTTAAVYRSDFSGIILSAVLVLFSIFIFVKRDRFTSIIKTYSKKNES